MLTTAVSSNRFHANLRCTKLVAWKQFLFYIIRCIGKTLNITYSESVFIALAIQHTKRIRHIIMCLAPLYKIFNIIL
jgi:hypothetical protein